MANNPFTLTFGTEPIQYINRNTQTNEIISTFSGEMPATNVYMISGVRGSGKTVLLTNIADYFEKKDEWIVVNVTPDVDILNTVAAKLYSRSELKKLFVQAKLDLSAFGLGVSIEKGSQIFDIETALEKMLAELDKKKKRVLITIDEVVKNINIKIFAGVFQLFIRQKLPVYLIMTGLYDNIYNLQNEDTLTFLYRAPKVVLEPLSIGAIASSYAKVFDMAREEAGNMAKLTKGYPFAYQVLGYLFWDSREKKKNSKIEDVIPEYDHMLEEYVYEKIWSELSQKEKDIIAILAENESTKVIDIRERLNYKSNEMSVYRDRLKKKGIIDVSSYGSISLKLPRFGEVISYWV